MVSGMVLVSSAATLGCTVISGELGVTGLLNKPSKTDSRIHTPLLWRTDHSV